MARYPKVRTRPYPRFLCDKYRDLRGFLNEVARRGAADGLPAFDQGRFLKVIPDFERAFDVTTDEMEAAFGLSPNESRRYRVITQRLLLWADLDSVVKALNACFDRVIANLPHSLRDIEEGLSEAARKKKTKAEKKAEGRDILDPFIVSFASPLLESGSVPSLVRALVIHKCFMKLEDMIGHAHGEALGRAGGGDTVPEPKGKADGGKLNKQEYHAVYNPYPGADARRGEEEFYQIKNKTGSAKGSDGEKLGRQFLVLKEHYPGSKRFYVSMVGRTLKGHRSMGAFLRTDPEAEVMVGLAAFQQMGRHRDTADIVFDLYRELFANALERNHYDLEEIVGKLTTEWRDKHGNEDPLHNLLRDSITNTEPREQFSGGYHGLRELKKSTRAKTTAVSRPRKGTKKSPKELF